MFDIATEESIEHRFYKALNIKRIIVQSVNVVTFRNDYLIA